ncbi:DUF1893 domain-containing protein [Ruminococcus sp.]|uniref:DUF1893 domain-containing protein n=1 Tax=Ruminococcus sp. TaxID=41978 RepID=UPI0025E8F793|nr:DUF1893 domain-containing protein [Ruminococcus sp.]MBQ8965772.1 DUF1893 domain-containing protein [Ruminococcus sp.]
MTDLEIAKVALAGHTICLCKDGKTISDDSKGISPMIGFISRGVDLNGFSVADLIVGKAAAMLFIKAGITAVHGNVMSVGGKDILEQYKIPYSYDTLADSIINRQGTDICPMEKTVAKIFDIDEAYEAICAKLEQLRSNK